MQAFVQSYRKKRKGGLLSATTASPASTTGPSSAAPAPIGSMEDNLGSDADTPNKTPGAGGARKTTTASASATTVGNTFFGPDFSPEAVMRGDGSQGHYKSLYQNLVQLISVAFAVID